MKERYLFLEMKKASIFISLNEKNQLVVNIVLWNLVSPMQVFFFMEGVL